jgi:hypothetical protein
LALARQQVRALFDDLRKRIDRKSVDAGYLRRSDARSLAMALVDTIMWSNYERVMDTLQVVMLFQKPEHLFLSQDSSKWWCLVNVRVLINLIQEK